MDVVSWVVVQYCVLTRCRVRIQYQERKYNVDIIYLMVLTYSISKGRGTYIHTYIYSINLSLHTFVAAQNISHSVMGPKPYNHRSLWWLAFFFVSFSLYFFFCSLTWHVTYKMSVFSSHRWLCRYSFFVKINLPNFNELQLHAW